MSLDDLLHAHAKRQPAKPAVLTPERSISYGELDESLTCLARHLLDRGLQRGDRVAVHWRNSIETVQLLLATLRAGLIAVPINPRLKPAEITHIFEHSQARICFSEPALAPLAEEALRTGGPEVANELPPLTNRSGALPGIDLDRPAVILYTSGTTAHPKGVTHTHRTLSASARLLTPDPVGPNDTALAMTQLAHASSLNCILLPVLYEGASVALLRTFEPAPALDAIEQFRCTYIVALPAMLQFMVQEQAQRPRDVSSLHNYPEMELDWLDKAIDQREPIVTLLKTWPVFDAVRSHPKYPALVRKMNLG